MLITVTLGAIALMTAAMLTENLWLLASVGLFHSVMWSCVFTLAVDGLGEYTSRASGVFMMGVFGGAVFPVLQGMLADWIGSWQFRKENLQKMCRIYFPPVFYTKFVPKSRKY